MTQIRRIKADAKKYQQEVLTTTNIIQDTIEKNNVIFSKKWEVTHDHINRRSEETHLLKNWMVDLEALSGLQQTTLQSCQNTIAGLEETVIRLTASVTTLEKLLLRLFVVASSILCAWRGGRNGRGDGRGGRRGGGGKS